MEPTPLVRWNFLDAPKREVFAKLEDRNPSGSIKDRMAGFVLDTSIEDGLLRPGMRIVEASSGNAGAAIALAAKERGYQVTICVAATTAAEKIANIERFGATVEKVDTSNSPGAEIQRAKQLAKSEECFFFNQFENPLHVRGYKENLVPEILSELTKLRVVIDTFIGGVGTGASIIAIGSALRKFHNRDLKIVAVSPESSPTDIEGLHPGDLVPLGHFQIWKNRTAGLENAIIKVSDRDAYESLLEIERETGELYGPATGAAIAALRTIEEPGKTLVLATDSGKRYFEKISKWR